MTQFTKTSLLLDHKFEGKTKRHFINNFQTVYHCHHFTTLYTQLAIDAGETCLLARTAEDSFHALLCDYYENHEIFDISERIEIACQYYAAVGMGKIVVNFLGNDSGEVCSPHSHIDTGWIKKWGQYDKPVNYIGCGYINAMFAAILDLPVGSFESKEIKSIVKGADASMFKIVRK